MGNAGYIGSMTLEEALAQQKNNTETTDPNIEPEPLTPDQEYEKIVSETGNVPIGWLPIDGNKNDFVLNELQEKIKKQRKYIMWGIGAFGHDVITKGKMVL